MTQIERTPEEIATEIAKSAAKVAMVRALYSAARPKTAAAPASTLPGLLDVISPARVSALRGDAIRDGAIRGSVFGAVPGGLAGAAAADDDHRWEGAAKGALGGSILGALGGGLVGAGRSNWGQAGEVADMEFYRAAPRGLPEMSAADRRELSEAHYGPLRDRLREGRDLLDKAELGGIPLAGAAAGYAAAPASEKQASVSSMALRALGGALAGGAIGGGAGALSAHLRGADMRQSAATGALGGAGIGAGLGALSSGVKGTELQELQHRQFGAATAGVLGGAGALFGKKLVGSLVGGEDSEAAEARQKELGRFEAMQQIKVKQLALLEPMHAAAFEHAQQDEIISRADPSLVHSSFETMKRFAPNIAADPNAVRSFLRESASWGAGPSYATLKNLADAERSVAGAGGAV